LNLGYSVILRDDPTDRLLEANRSSITGPLSASPVLSLSGRVEHPLDMPIERPQHSDARVHQRPAIFRRHDQRFGGRLPFVEVLFALRQFHDVGGGLREGEHLAAVGQFDWILETAGPVNHDAAMTG